MPMSADVARSLRKQYAALIEMLTATGQADHARECAETATRNGMWRHPLQRPTEYNPELPPTALYDPGRFWFVPYLEEQYPVIREEVLQVVEPRREGFSPVEEPLVGKGQWDEVVFYEGGLRMERSCARFPRTAEIMSKVPEAIQSGGVVMLSWLHAGSHIVPHCGATNSRLRVHLGVRVPEGASMRVGDRRFVWEEGKCVVFDDSFEHEVWNLAPEPRVVLLFDVIHPDLPAEAQAARKAGRPALDDTVKTFLASRGIAGVERDPRTDELTVFPDDATTRTITRYMKDHNVTRVQMAQGALEME